VDTKGQHIIIDAFDCQPDLLNQVNKLKELLTNAAMDAGMEILWSHFHPFHPQGVTGVILLSTSHFSIHTWPEQGYAALDLYTCGNVDVLPSIESVVHQLGAKRARIYEHTRGKEEEHSTITKKLLSPPNSRSDRNRFQIKESKQLFHLRDDRGNERDMIQLKEIMAGKHVILHHGASSFQEVLLVEASDLRLYIDQELQFSSLDERYYHEALVHPVMGMASNPERILILGGGDGLALREVLKYPTVRHVDLVDIDPLIVDLAKNIPALTTLNEKAFHDERVHVHVQNAKQFVAAKPSPYDVIIVDFPDPVDSVISALYTKEFFSEVSQLLSHNGLLVCQSNSPEDTPRVFWSIAQTLESASFHTLPYQVIVPSFGLWGFHLAGPKPLTAKAINVSIPHQTLPKNMEQLFEFSTEILAIRQEAVINSLNKPCLHELYQEEIQQIHP
jgi:spermidine synthase